jgi:tetratricopeptide (TPR) repeat protein
MEKPEPKPSTDSSAPPFTPGWRRGLSRLLHFSPRESWWWFLSHWEKRRWLRRSLYTLVVTGILAAGLWQWAYPVWLRRNAIKIARAWMAAGKLHNAAEMVQKANELMPGNPEPWLLGSELARLGNQEQLAVRYARRAAKLDPTSAEAVMTWASAALRADLPDEAAEALRQLPPDIMMNSGLALRLRGELARRKLHLTVARQCFEEAVRIEGPLAVNQVPLGLILLLAKDPELKKSGHELLRAWTSDPAWGPAALRALLTHAMDLGDQPAMRQWSEALLVHPRRAVGDMQLCLGALARVDEVRFQSVLQGLEVDHAVSPQAAAQLLDWLNQIGRPDEGVRWMQTLPAAAMQIPPLAVLAAEALRASGNWEELAARTARQDWGNEFEFLRWAYALQAYDALGQTARAGELRETLFNHAKLNKAHSLFIASTLYSWGRIEDAKVIWWQAADQGGKIAVESLGALARHFQVMRDADGQYQVFRRLYFMKPRDVAIANNFAFFALLTGRELRLAASITWDNLVAEPDNETYAATRAFALLKQGEARTALSLIEPLAKRADPTPAVLFAYGLVLADSDRQNEARELLGTLPTATMTAQEIALIQSALSR